MAATLLIAEPMPAHLKPRSSGDLPTDAGQSVSDSANELEHQLHNALRSSPYRQLSRIVCRVDSGIATLHGRVNSFYLKQIAQERAARVGSIVRVVNLVEVDDA